MYWQNAVTKPSCIFIFHVYVYFNFQYNWSLFCVPYYNIYFLLLKLFVVKTLTGNMLKSAFSISVVTLDRKNKIMIKGCLSQA